MTGGCTASGFERANTFTSPEQSEAVFIARHLEHSTAYEVGRGKDFSMRLQITLVALTLFSAPVMAQSTPPARLGEGQNDTLLNELRTAPVPKQEKDLDTLQLASAQRDQAASIDEKTNGLWQSWTMSICEGCGNSASYKKTVSDDAANRKPLYVGSSEGKAARRQALTSHTRTPDRIGRSLYADLSTENISQIRRMPGQ